jgi:hypothetical protein
VRLAIRIASLPSPSLESIVFSYFPEDTVQFGLRKKMKRVQAMLMGNLTAKSV